MTLTSPDWLARRGGSLCPSADGQAWIVLLDQQPHYRLVPVPVAGKYGCQVTQTVSGKRLDSGAAFDTLEDSLRGGLEDLRKALGW
jgi:hypothetical protein